MKTKMITTLLSCALLAATPLVARAQTRAQCAKLEADLRYTCPHTRAECAEMEDALRPTCNQCAGIKEDGLRYGCNHGYSYPTNSTYIDSGACQPLTPLFRTTCSVCMAADPAFLTFWTTPIAGNMCERFGLQENWESLHPEMARREAEDRAERAEGAVAEARRKQVMRALEARVKAGATPRQALDDAYDDCVSGRTPAADCPEGLSPSR
jgi:hypothetical protein